MSIISPSASTPCKLFIFPISIEKPENLKQVAGPPNWKAYVNVLKLSEKPSRHSSFSITYYSNLSTKTHYHLSSQPIGIRLSSIQFCMENTRLECPILRIDSWSYL